MSQSSFTQFSWLSGDYDYVIKSHTSLMLAKEKHSYKCCNRQVYKGNLIRHVDPFNINVIYKP